MKIELILKGDGVFIKSYVPEDGNMLLGTNIINDISGRLNNKYSRYELCLYCNSSNIFSVTTY